MDPRRPMDSRHLRHLIREAQDASRCDLSPLLADAAAWRQLIEELAAPFAADRITHVAAIDALGFLLGGAVAIRLGAGVVPIRKPGKAAWRAHAAAFTDYTGRPGSLELADDVLRPGHRVLLVDDWAETGAQLQAATILCEGAGATVIGAAVINADDTARRQLRLPRLHAVLRY